MSARKPAVPRSGIPIVDPPSANSLAEPSNASSPEAIVAIEGGGEDRHINLELESGPIDREDREDPLPEMP